MECDIEWTSDNVPVLLHDSSIDRTSDGTGELNSLTLEQVRQYDFGSWKHSKYTDTKIPTFEEFILHCKKINLHPYIEIKDNSEITEERMRILVNIVKKYKMSDKCSWISFSSNALTIINLLLPNARLGFLIGALNQTSLQIAQNLKTDKNKVFIDMDYNCIQSSIECVKEAIELGIEVEAWTVNNESVVDSLFENNISGITTDFINVSKLFQS